MIIKIGSRGLAAGVALSFVFVTAQTITTTKRVETKPNVSLSHRHITPSGVVAAPTTTKRVETKPNVSLSYRHVTATTVVPTTTSTKWYNTKPAAFVWYQHTTPVTTPTVPPITPPRGSGGTRAATTYVDYQVPSIAYNRVQIHVKAKVSAVFTTPTITAPVKENVTLLIITQANKSFLTNDVKSKNVVRISLATTNTAALTHDEPHETKVAFTVTGRVLATEITPTLTHVSTALPLSVSLTNTALSVVPEKETFEGKTTITLLLRNRTQGATTVPTVSTHRSIAPKTNLRLTHRVFTHNRVAQRYTAAPNPRLILTAHITANKTDRPRVVKKNISDDEIVEIITLLDSLV